MSESGDIDSRQEIEPNPQLVIASSTLYKDWYPGEKISLKDVDKLRGDTAIDSFRRAVDKGFKVIDIDAGSNPSFVDTLSAAGVKVVEQPRVGLSESRRQGIILASALNPAAILTTEPEKPSLIDSVDELLKPIIEGRADIVIAQRNQMAFDSYPPTQAGIEKKANKLANNILKKHGLLSEDALDLDLWMGPRMLRNDPKIIDLFLRRYDFKKLGSSLDSVIDLERWSNALFLPVVEALSQGFRVVGLPISYKHPEIMTESETGLREFDRKREIQFKGIIISIIEMVKKIEQEKGISQKPTRLV